MENHSQAPRCREQFFQDNMFLEKEKHLSEYVYVLYRQKILIFLFFVLVILMTVLVTWQTTPVYQATARLVIDDEKNVSLITGQITEYDNYISQDLAFQTHLELVTSAPVIETVIKILNSDRLEKKEPGIGSFKPFIHQFRRKIKYIFDLNHGQAAASLVDPEIRRMNNLVRYIQSKIDIDEVRNTRLLNIMVKDTDPELAADIANTLAQKYIEFNIAGRVQSSQENLEWLKNELHHLKKQLEDDEKAFYHYKQETKVFSMEGKQKVVDQKITEFNNKYLDTRNKRLVLDSKIKEIERLLKSNQGLVSVRSLISNGMIETINNKIVALEIEYSKLSKVYKYRHPQIIEIKSELDKSRNRLDDELAKELANLKSEYSVLLVREKILGKTIEEFEQDALETSGKELNYTILQRNVDTSQHLYDAIVARVKESDILKTSGISNIRIVEKAKTPESPISPDKRRNLLTGIVLGIFGGVCLAFFLDYLDQTLRTEKEVKDCLGLTVVAIIPEADKTEGYGFER